MDLVSAEPATSRRSMFGVAGAVGLAAAVGALTIARPAAAAPYAPTPADQKRLLVLMKLELTARDLYQASVDAGLAGTPGELAATFASNHAAYGQAIAGSAGLSATAGFQKVFDQFEPAFTSGEATEWATAAHELEATFVATHTEATATFEAIESINLITSILVVEARAAMILADVGGFADIDAIMSATEATALGLDALAEVGA